MNPWKLYFYSPWLGFIPAWEWYEAQREEKMQVGFDLALEYFRANESLAGSFGITVAPLDGKYLGLHEIRFIVHLEDGERQFGIIGKYKLEKPEFVLFGVCDRYGETYFIDLDTALEYAQEWERNDPKGEEIDEADLE